MNFSNARTHHHSDYQRRHIELNNHVKISIAAIDLLYSSCKTKEALTEKLSQLIVDAGERWTRTILKDPHLEITRTRRQISEMAIVRVYSSFNVFTDEISGSYNEYKNVGATSGATPVEKIYNSFGWSMSNISYLLPVLNFYQIARHCIAHQMGSPNAEVDSILSDPAFQAAISSWPTVNPTRSLSAAPKVSNGLIYLSPHHSITYSDVCLRVVRDIDRRLIRELGTSHFARKIGDRDVIKMEEPRDLRQRDVYRYIRSKLDVEFGIRDMSILEVRETLGGDDQCKKYFRKYEKLRSMKKV